MQYLQWILDEIGEIRQFPRLAVGIVLLVGAVSWWTSRLYYTVRISNLKSQVGLLQTQLEARPDTPLGPLPRYSLGGSNVLVYNNEDWTNQDTARRVELDWASMGNLNADAVFRMRTEGEPGWVQGRIMNVTDGEVVATTERHSGREILERSRLPRARGVKTYVMRVRGQNAGLEGEIQIVPSGPATGP